MLQVGFCRLLGLSCSLILIVVGRSDHRLYSISFNTPFVYNAISAPLPKEVEDRVKACIGCDIKQGWGMSELSPIGRCLNRTINYNIPFLFLLNYYDTWDME